MSDLENSINNSTVINNSDEGEGNNNNIDYSNIDSDIDSEHQCTICFNNLTDNTKYILNCNHMFCIECIDKLIETSKYNCPLCRTKITTYSNDNIRNSIVYVTNRGNNRPSNRSNIVSNIPICFLFVTLLFSSYKLSNDYTDLYNFCILNNNISNYT